jgi:hypothetical protein
MDFKNDSTTWIETPGTLEAMFHYTWTEDGFTDGERGTTLGDPALAEVEVTTEGLEVPA